MSAVTRFARKVLRRLERRSERVVPIPRLTDMGALLAGRRALITGGSGSLGSEIARTFIDSGATVVLAGRTGETLNCAVRDLGGSAEALVLDLAKPETFADRLDSIGGGLPDILVNCGGILGRSTFGQLTPAEYDAVMSTNVRGAVFLSQELACRWISAGVEGNILNISSGSQFKPGWTAYQISKNAMEAATRGMAAMLIDHGIVVNAIAPGPISGPMLGIDHSDIAKSDNPTGRLSPRRRSRSGPASS